MVCIDFYIRKLTEEHHKDIAHLCGQLGYPTLDTAVLPRIKSIMALENHQVFVAVTLPKEKVIGWVHVHKYPLLECDLTAEIGGLIVDEVHRKKGVGRLLMQNAEEWARHNKCGFLSLRSNKIRAEAHKFYEGIGYLNVKEQYTFRKQL